VQGRASVEATGTPRCDQRDELAPCFQFHLVEACACAWCSGSVPVRLAFHSVIVPCFGHSNHRGPPGVLNTIPSGSCTVKYPVLL
jgi:hypothetical protein